MPDTIPWTECCTRLNDDHPTLPLLRFPAGPKRCMRLEYYFPDWAPLARVDALCADARQITRDADVVAVFVTDVPREALFGDWGTHAPEGKP